MTRRPTRLDQAYRRAQRRADIATGLALLLLMALWTVGIVELRPADYSIAVEFAAYLPPSIAGSSAIYYLTRPVQTPKQERN